DNLTSIPAMGYRGPETPPWRSCRRRRRQLRRRKAWACAAAEAEARKWVAPQSWKQFRARYYRPEAVICNRIAAVGGAAKSGRKRLPWGDNTCVTLTLATPLGTVRN